MCLDVGAHTCHELAIDEGNGVVVAQRRLEMAKTNPTNLSFARTYDHKAHGRIGVATLQVQSPDEVKFILNGTELPAQSVDHLLTFALQSLQDAYAGAESASDAVEKFTAKLERILAGTLGTRGGNGVSEETRLIRMVLRPLVKEALGAAAWKELGDDERNAQIDAVFESMGDEDRATVAAAVETERKRLAAEAAAKAGLKGAIKIKL